MDSQWLADRTWATAHQADYQAIGAPDQGSDAFRTHHFYRILYCAQFCRHFQSIHRCYGDFDIWRNVRLACGSNDCQSAVTERERWFLSRDRELLCDDRSDAWAIFWRGPCRPVWGASDAIRDHSLFDHPDLHKPLL